MQPTTVAILIVEDEPVAIDHFDDSWRVADGVVENDSFIFASSPESVGEFWLGEVSQTVI